MHTIGSGVSRPRVSPSESASSSSQVAEHPGISPNGGPNSPALNPVNNAAGRAQPQQNSTPSSDRGGSDYPWNPAGIIFSGNSARVQPAQNPIVGESSSSSSSLEQVAVPLPTGFTSVRQVERQAEARRERAQAISDSITALGTSGGYATEAMRGELLDVLVEVEGGDISTAWQVRALMDTGLNIDEARQQVREPPVEKAASTATFDPESVGLTPQQYSTAVNALVADGMANADAEYAVQVSAIEYQQERTETLNTYIANLFQVSETEAADIVALSNGGSGDGSGTIASLPDDVQAAINRVEIRFIHGTEQPFLTGRPVDVELIGDYFSNKTGAAIGAHRLNNGDWATERPLDAHLAASEGTDIHLFLDVMGFVPVIGEAADGLNALIYLAEGDEQNAAISAAALVPVAGSAATGGRLLSRSKDLIDGVGATLIASSKVDNATVNLLELSDGSLVKVVELENGQSLIMQGSADALGESADKVAAAGRVSTDAVDDVLTPPVREIPFDSDAVLVGSSRSTMRRNASRIIANDPDHPLRFLLDETGTKFKSADGTSHYDLINQPSVVQMGHVVSAKTGEPEWLVLQTGYENQLLNNSIERPSIGGAVLGFPVIEVGGIAVSKESAELWELLGFLPEGTVANAAAVTFP